jgi:hypothetical protein
MVRYPDARRGGSSRYEELGTFPAFRARVVSRRDRPFQYQASPAPYYI